jgi:hypothetical protein
MIRVLLFSALFIVVVSCKKTPTNSPVIPPEVEGVYLGWGRPGNNAMNTRLEFDSTSSGWHGTIQYNGTSSSLTITEVSEDQDSVRFQYTRGATYRYLGVLTGVSITLYVLEPSGEQAYILNKAQNGFNLSGDWNGLMYSQYLQVTEPANLYVDQQGALYDGDIQSSFGFYTLIGDILQGGIDGDGFYLTGEATFSGTRYPLRFDGNFVTEDSIAGIWQVSISGGSDGGTFGFGRHF